MWRRMLHHLVDQHEWGSGDAVGPAQCLHEPLTQEQYADHEKCPFLKKDSHAKERLNQMALDQRFIKTLFCYTKFRHTGVK